MSEDVPNYTTKRDRRTPKDQIGKLEPRPFSEEAFLEMIDACDHIARTCRKSATSTRRLRWIEQRAIDAVEGTQLWREKALPKNRPRVEFAEDLIARIYLSVKDFAEMLRSSYEEGPGGPISDLNVVDDLDTLESWLKDAKRLPAVRVTLKSKHVEGDPEWPPVQLTERFMDDHLAAGQDVHMFGKPVDTFTHDELVATIGYLMKKRVETAEEKSRRDKIFGPGAGK